MSPYNEKLCDERHRKIDNAVQAFSDRVRTLELRVVAIVAIGTILLPIAREVATFAFRNVIAPKAAAASIDTTYSGGVHDQRRFRLDGNNSNHPRNGD